MDEGWERCLDIDEMEAVRAPLEDCPISAFRSRDDDSGSILTILFALAVIIGVVSVVVYLVMAR